MEGNLSVFYELVKKNVKSFYPENAIKYILNEVLKGIFFMHENHVVHRDIRAANLLFSKQGGIKIGDFGSSV
jgi:serine/threonine protein kinase